MNGHVVSALFQENRSISADNNIISNEIRGLTEIEAQLLNGDPTYTTTLLDTSYHFLRSCREHKAEGY